MRTRVYLMVVALVAAAATVHGQGLQTEVTAPTGDMRPGQPVTVGIRATNTNVPEPIVLTVHVEWSDAYGAAHQADFTYDKMRKIHPITVSILTADIPGMQYIANSANIGSDPIAATLSGSRLSLPVGRELLDGETIEVGFQARGD